MWTKIWTLVITVRKRSCGKVMFLHLSVILFTRVGGCNPTCITGHMGRHPLGRHPPCSCMVNERVVHILLECILVCTKGLFTRCDRDYDLLSKRECIPVGSVLTTRCPYLGGGGWVPGAGGGTWSRGCTWSRGGAPGPRGVYLVLEGGSARYTLPGPDQVHPPRPDQVPPPDQTKYYPLWTELQTGVKILPWPNFVAAGNKRVVWASAILKATRQTKYVLSSLNVVFTSTMSMFKE